MATSGGEGTMAAAATQLNQGISQLFKSERFSDVVVRCGDREWPAHKNVLCTQSEFFAKACEGDFKEAADNVIELFDDYPDAVYAMLCFLYTADYEDGTEVDEGGQIPCHLASPAALLHVRVYVLAEKYLLEHLKTHAANKFTRAAQSALWADAFADTIAEAYKTTQSEDSLLRSCIMDVVVPNVKHYFNPEFDYKYFREVAGQIPEFMVKLVELVSQERFQVDICPFGTCGRYFKCKAAKGQSVSLTCGGCGEYAFMSYEDLQEYERDLAEMMVTKR